MLMLDLCSGLGGAFAAMRDRGWSVVTVDIDPQFEPDIVADVRDWMWDGRCPDLIWASPPCVEFSREFMPWSKTGKRPDMSIVLACKRIIDEVSPRFWVIENVKGAVYWFKPILGRPRTIIGPFYLWGFFPDPGRIKLRYRHKESRSSQARAERAKIPYVISYNLAVAIESQCVLV